MFENNADYDFGDDFTLDFENRTRNAANKRRSEPQKIEEPKKAKLSQPPKFIVERKFPGPAGILPDRKDFNSTCEAPNTKQQEEISCSQMSISIFHSPPWLEMTHDYGSLLKLYSIKWIKTNAGLHKLPNQKAPFLAAVIKNIECFEGTNLIVKVVLKDMSGEIQGTVFHSLYEKYSDSLVAGSVIVLRQCGVLTTSYSSNHYLTITPKNLMSIYWKNNDELAVISVQESSQEEVAGSIHQRKKSNQREDREEKENESCSQLKIKGTEEEVQTWEDALEGVDMDSFFEDF